MKLSATLKYAAYIIIGVAAILFLLRMRSCEPALRGTTEKSVHHIVIEQIEELGRLELVRYRMKDVVEKHIDRPWYMLIGDTRLLLVVGGEAVGCIDLKKIKPEDITGTDTLIITLPQPEICYSKVNHNETKFYHAQGSPRIIDSSPYLEDAYREAEKKIHEAARESGILEQTRKNATQVLLPLLKSVSGKEIVLRYSGE